MCTLGVVGSNGGSTTPKMCSNKDGMDLGSLGMHKTYKALGQDGCNSHEP